jgi:hypothetical protein
MTGTRMARPAVDTERHGITMTVRMPSGLGFWVGLCEGLCEGNRTLMTSFGRSVVSEPAYLE